MIFDRITNGDARVLAILLTLVAGGGPAVAQDAVTRVSVVPDHNRVSVHVHGPSVTPRINEPFYLPDRTRLHLIIEGARLAPEAITPDGPAIIAAGLLGLVARERDGGVRLSVEAAAIVRYGVEQQHDGFVFWLVLTPTIGPRIADSNFGRDATVRAITVRSMDSLRSRCAVPIGVIASAA